MNTQAPAAPTAPNDPRILIAGTGAMACLFAAHLSAAGAQVTLLGSWIEGLHALQQHGVRLIDAAGNETCHPVQATATTRDCRGIPHSLVLVKAWQTASIARQLACCLPAGGLALSLQNGVGNYETLAGILGAERAALGVTTLGATLLSPGLVRQAGEGAISLGPPQRPHLRLLTLAAWLRKAGFSVQETPDAKSLLWGKLVVNAAINPLTALLRLPNGELLQRPASRALMQSAAQEAAAVAAALGIELPYPDAAARAEQVARLTAANRSSMLQDVLRGSPTEIDAICGAIVRAGEACGVPAPVNRTLWQLVTALTKSATRQQRQDTKITTHQPGSQHHETQHWGAQEIR